MKRKMKRLATIVCLAMCVVIIVPCVLSSCSKKEEKLKEKIENEILGTWRGVDKYGDVRELKFNPDGTVEYRWVSGSYEKVDSGTYSLMMTKRGNEVYIDLEEMYFTGIEFEYNEDNGTLTLKKDEIYFAKVK